MKKGLVYLDHAAHTPCLDNIIESMGRTASAKYGNAASTHRWGLNTHEELRRARLWFAEHFDVTPKHVIFTSGGTEADNLAILGVLRRKDLSKQHVVTTTVEHVAVYHLFKKLEHEGLRVSYVKVGLDGVVSPRDIEAAILPETSLVSVIGVNNEVGSIQPIYEIGTAIKNANPKCLFHVDGVQAFGKIHIPLLDNHIDLLSLSAHKIHGPVGAGALIQAGDFPLIPLLIGGGQESGIRGGTENVPAIQGFYLAAKEITEEYEKNFQHVKRLWDHCREELEAISSRICINSPADGSPYILNFSIKKLPAEVGVRMYNELGVGLSAGSACTHSTAEQSRILKALGLSDDIAIAGLRISFCHFTKEDEVKIFLEATRTILQQWNQKHTSHTTRTQ